MAAQVPVEPGVKHNRYESERREALFKSTHADVLVLRQRTEEAGTLLPGVVAAAAALHSGAGTCANSERKRHGEESVLETGSTLPEMPCHRRSRSRQDRDRAQLSSGERTPETRLGGAVDYRSPVGESRHCDALRFIQATE